MISDELKEIIDQIKEQGRMSFLEAATEEQIEKFEKENDMHVVFPQINYECQSKKMQLAS